MPHFRTHPNLLDGAMTDWLPGTACSNGSSGFREESAVGQFESLSFDKATPFLRLAAELDEISHTFRTPSGRTAIFLASMFPKGCWLGRTHYASAEAGRM